MVMTDPIADMLTRIRNAGSALHDSVDVPASNMKRSIAKILKQEGFVRDFQVIESGPQGTIRLYLKYGPNKEQIINGIKRISRPGLRIYCRKDEVPKVLGGLGVAIVSTSKGIVPDKVARQLGIGGEVICYVW